MTQHTKLDDNSQTSILEIRDDGPKRTIGHASIQEHPNISEYLMENQSLAPSSIYQSNILDHSVGYVRLKNQTTPAPSQYYDPNEANHTIQDRSKRFIFKIPAIRAGDRKNKVIRTKITFNLKNLLQNSSFGSNEINHKFVNFSESDVEPIKKVSKHVILLDSDEISVKKRVSSNSHNNIELQSGMTDDQQNDVNVCHSTKSNQTDVII